MCAEDIKYILFTNCIFIGCSEHSGVFVTITNIDDLSSTLSLKFEFHQKGKPINIFIDTIRIYENFGIKYEIKIKKWANQLSLPDDCNKGKVLVPIEKQSIVLFKSNRYSFFLWGRIKRFTANGWTYRPNYSTSEGRWLFNDEGKEIRFIHANYKRYGFSNDQIKIHLSKKQIINTNSFFLTDINNKFISKEIEFDENPTDEIRIIIPKARDKNDELVLNIHNDIMPNRYKKIDKKYFQYWISVPDRSTYIILD